MHMSDALLSPAVGGVMWGASAIGIAYSSSKLKKDLDSEKVPLMGALGAFVFAAQMINFTIPATGSSGHLGGGMILAILLGPHAAFLTMASILTVQALFFADGGLLALGCNIFNMGFLPCFIAYPFVYKKVVGDRPTPRRILMGAMIASILGLELGALGVVLETTLSGIAELPFTTFALVMLPIHLAIGIVEGFITAGVVTFVWKARPEILEVDADLESNGKPSIKVVLATLSVVTLIVGGMLSWFASSHPDGLEWSLFRVSGKEELSSSGNGPQATLGRLQEKTAILPDYGFKTSEAQASKETKTSEAKSWPSVDTGTSASGVIGALITMGLACLIGFGLRSYHRRK